MLFHLFYERRVIALYVLLSRFRQLSYVYYRSLVRFLLYAGGVFYYGLGLYYLSLYAAK